MSYTSVQLHEDINEGYFLWNSSTKPTGYKGFQVTEEQQLILIFFFILTWQHFTADRKLDRSYKEWENNYGLCWFSISFLVRTLTQLIL